MCSANLHLKYSTTAEAVSDLIIEELIRNSVDTFVVSPGVRAIPLIEAIKNNPAASMVLINDERSAGFWAQGRAKATGKAVALLCTSGTALANYFPAVVEASLAGVPLIVISADRPWELQNCKANQTIKQHNIFSSYAKLAIDIPAMSEKIFPQSILANIDQLVATAQNDFPGVVHLNIAFRKPFIGSELLKLDSEEVSFILKWKNSGTVLRNFITGSSNSPEQQSDSLILYKRV